MSTTEPSLPAIDEVRELNHLFLAFLRDRPAAAAARFGLPPSAADLFRHATEDQIRRAASFPRALFRIHLPTSSAGPARDPLTLATRSGVRVLELVILHSARNVSRISGYAARLLLRLDDTGVERLRTAEVDEIVSMSLADDVVRAAFDDLDWIWQELLHEARPEYRRRLLLIGFQPDLSPQPALGLA